jgi:hypothetical protein
VPPTVTINKDKQTSACLILVMTFFLCDGYAPIARRAVGI